MKKNYNFIAVPGIRFKEFNEKWKSVSLNILLNESKSRNKNDTYSRNDVLSVTDDYGLVNQIQHLGRSYAGKSLLNYKVVEIGDVVYTKSPLKDTPYGIIKANSFSQGIVSTLYAVYKCTDICYHSWINYYFSLHDNVNKYLRPLVRKGAKNDMKVNNVQVLSDSIFLPSIKEQKKIASFLFLINNWIENLEKQKTSLEEYKKGVMQKIFTQEIRFKDDNGNEYNEWEEKRASKIFKSFSNKNHNGSLPILSASQQYGMVYRNSNGIKIQTSSKSILSYKVVEKGDFVISLRSFQGGIEYSNLKGICSPAYTILKPKKDIHNEFFKFYFKKESFIEKLSKTVVGIRDGKQISYNAFGSLKLQIPSILEQQKIANFLLSIDNLIKSKEKQIKKSKEWKKGLLQQMFV